MEIELIRGCICSNLLINGKEEINLNDTERKQILKAVFKALKPEDLNIVLQKLTECFGEYESDDTPCECCGDYVERYIWKI